jgi:hypothetical protein
VAIYRDVADASDILEGVNGSNESTTLVIQSSLSSGFVLTAKHSSSGLLFMYIPKGAEFGSGNAKSPRSAITGVPPSIGVYALYRPQCAAVLGF